MRWPSFALAGIALAVIGIAGWQIWETEQLADGKKRENPYSLYDIAADPQERHDLLTSAERNSQTERLFTTLASALRDAVPAYAEPVKTYAPVDPQTRERLRALGYSN